MPTIESLQKQAVTEQLGRLKQANQYLSDHLPEDADGFFIDTQLKFSRSLGKTEMKFSVVIQTAWETISPLLRRKIEVNDASTPLSAAKKAISRWKLGENDASHLPSPK